VIPSTHETLLLFKHLVYLRYFWTQLLVYLFILVSLKVNKVIDQLLIFCPDLMYHPKNYPVNSCCIFIRWLTDLLTASQIILVEYDFTDCLFCFSFSNLIFYLSIASHFSDCDNIISTIFQSLHVLVFLEISRIILLRRLRGDLLRIHLLRSSRLFLMATISSRNWSKSLVTHFWTCTECHTLSHNCSKTCKHTTTLWLLLNCWWGSMHRNWLWWVRSLLGAGLLNN